MYGSIIMRINIHTLVSQIGVAVIYEKDGC